MRHFFNQNDFARVFYKFQYNKIKWEYLNQLNKQKLTEISH